MTKQEATAIRAENERLNAEVERWKEEWRVTEAAVERWKEEWRVTEAARDSFEAAFAASNVEIERLRAELARIVAMDEERCSEALEDRAKLAAAIAVLHDWEDYDPDDSDCEWARRRDAAIAVLQEKL